MTDEERKRVEDVRAVNVVRMSQQERCAEDEAIALLLLLFDRAEQAVQWAEDGAASWRGKCEKAEAELKAERERHNRTLSERSAAWAERDEAVDWLNKHGTHTMQCSKERPGIKSGVCDCGFDAILAKLTPATAKEVKNGVCCDCGYDKASETECPKRDDKTHCEHWWDGPDEDPATPGKEGA